MKRHLVVSGIVLAALAVAVSGAMMLSDAAKSEEPAGNGRSGAVAHVDWVHRPETLGRLVRLSEVAVIASPVAAAPGPSLVSEEPDVAPIPTQRITFKVEDTWFGEVADEIVLFKTGSSEEWIEHDPPYQTGERYILFLQPRRDGLYIPVAPDGRLSIDGERARPSIPGPLSRQFQGMPVEELRQRARSEKGGQG